MKGCGGRQPGSGGVAMNSGRQTLRTTLPEHLALDAWEMPTLDSLDASQKKQFHSLAGAIRHYVGGGNISQYLRDHELHRETFYRAFDRCVTSGNRGKPMGWLGLLPYIEVRPRKRTAPIEASAGAKGGLSGALQLFLRENPAVRDGLHGYLCKNAKRKPGGEAGIRHKSVHVEFLRLCEADDPSKERWPFTSRRFAAGAVRSYVCHYIACNYDKIVDTQFGDKAATKSKAGTGHQSRLVACMPLDIVEMDEHNAGFIGSVRIQTPEGSRVVDAGRVTILLLVDRHKGLILAFKVVFREAANSGDALDVLHAAMVGEPGYAHRQISDSPERPLVELDPRFGWCGFNCLLLDNALIHLADELVSRTMSLCGCAINFGPVGTPARRQLVERIFNSMERAGFRRLRTTTGVGPLDPKRQNPEEVARRCTLTETEIVTLVADLVRKHNTDIGKHNLAASPVQRMVSLIAGEERDRYVFPFLPPLQQGEADLSILVVRVPVKGNQKTGRRPYFSYLEADYTSPLLARAWDCVDKWIVLHVTRSNIRNIPAFHNGRALGTCMPGGRWRWSDHSSDLRRHINQLTREGYITNDIGCDVVAAFTEQIGKDVVSTNSDKRAAKPSVRQLADHAVRRQGVDVTDGESSSRDAAQAVHDLLDRAGQKEAPNYMQWDDIGAFNGDGNGS